MEPANPLSKYCQTRREQRLVESCIKIAADGSHYWIISLICGLVLVGCTVVKAWRSGLDNPSFWVSAFTSILCLFIAQNMWRAKILGTVLKRISESK